MNATMHAKRRCRSRKGLNKKQAAKDFKNAWRKGLRIHEIPDAYYELRNYMRGKFNKHKYLRPTIVLHNGYLYIIVNGIVITMYELPEKLYKMAIVVKKLVEAKKALETSNDEDEYDPSLPNMTVEDFLGK